MNSVSIIIPVFNAALSLETLFQQLIGAADTIAKNLEIIMVDDGSADESWKEIARLQSQDSRLHGIRLGRNYGQHNALLCGIRAAQFETIVTLDDDLQNPVNEIPKLIKLLEDGYDVVYGTPEKKQIGLLRNIATGLTKLALQSAMGSVTARKVSSFRAFRTRLRDGFHNYNSPFVSIDVLLTWTTSKFNAVDVQHLPREHGDSNYTFSKLASHAIDLMTGFSSVPLRIASFFGFAFTIFGFVILSWVLFQYFRYQASVPGFPFLASIIIIFAGVQLLTLGVFGEYLARIHFRSMQKPAYSVESTTNEIQSK